MRHKTVFEFLGKRTPDLDPFPHLHLQEAFEPELLNELMQRLPPLSLISGGAGLPAEKFHLPARKALEEQGLDPLWKEIISIHYEPEAVRVWLGCFASAIRNEYPGLENELGKSIDSWTIGKRGLDRAEDFDLLLDSQLIVHMPCPASKAQERGPHLKISNKLLESQFYLRLPEDKDPGADFEIYAIDAGARLKFGPKSQVLNCERLKLVKSLPYQCGSGVLFLNSPGSVQTLSKRAFCKYPTYYLNFVLEAARPLFNNDLFTSSGHERVV